jgi:hypothetical protein
MALKRNINSVYSMNSFNNSCYCGWGDGWFHRCLSMSPVTGHSTTSEIYNAHGHSILSFDSPYLFHAAWKWSPHTQCGCGEGGEDIKTRNERWFFTKFLLFQKSRLSIISHRDHQLNPLFPHQPARGLTHLHIYYLQFWRTSLWWAVSRSKMFLNSWDASCTRPHIYIRDASPDYQVGGIYKVHQSMAMHQCINASVHHSVHQCISASVHIILSASEQEVITVFTVEWGSDILYFVR